MAKKITVCGKELDLRYTMHAAVAFEKMTGESALDLGKFQNNEIAPLVEMGYCMLVSSNPEVPAYEEVLKDMDSIEKMTNYIKAVSDELISFYKPDKTSSQNDDPAEKNA